MTMETGPNEYLDSYCRSCRDGGTFVYTDLLPRVLAANDAGLGRVEIVKILEAQLPDLEAQGREEEFETVAELVQRLVGFFSPHGVIHLKDPADGKP